MTEDSPELAALRNEMEFWQYLANSLANATMQFKLQHADEALKDMVKLQGYLVRVVKSAGAAEEGFQAALKLERPELSNPDPQPDSVTLERIKGVIPNLAETH